MVLESGSEVEVAESQPRVADVLAAWLVRVGVRVGFGVSGGGIAAFWHAVSHARGIRVFHTVHETGAAFAAAEASMSSGRPVLVFTTTGPGLTNALTGLCAARQEGAKVVLISGSTPPSRDLRGPTQETHAQQPFSGLYEAGGLFDEAWRLTHADQLGPALQRLELALARPGGAVVHLGLPADLAGLPAVGRMAGQVRLAPPPPDPDVLEALAASIADMHPGERGVLVVGHGARGAEVEVAALVERLGWPVVSTPRGKGIFPEDDPRCVGVVGVAGHREVDALLAEPMDWVVALGTSLSEASSGFAPGLDARSRLVLVGPPRGLPGGYAGADVTALEGDVARTLRTLVPRIRPRASQPAGRRAEPADLGVRPDGPVRPRALLRAVQARVLDRTDAVLLAESGNSFAWAIHELRLRTPRLRVSVGFGAMGHATCGVIGAALGGQRAVALVGDGAMLMQNELPTAVRDQLPATWIILNDSAYGMCNQGLAGIGYPGTNTGLPVVDFAAYAAAIGAAGRRVTREAELPAAVDWAVQGSGPRVLDVVIDPGEPAPIGRRVRALAWHDPTWRSV